MQKNNEFKWTQKQTSTFEALKKILRNKPIIKVFDPQKEVMLTTNASEKVIAVIIITRTSNHTHIKKVNVSRD